MKKTAVFLTAAVLAATAQRLRRETGPRDDYDLDFW